MRTFLHKISGGLEIKKVIIIASLLLFALNGSEYAYMKIPLIFVCLFALVIPNQKEAVLPWLAIIMIFLIGNIPHYFEIDNHKFLYFYWAIAIAACLHSGEFEKNIKINAKLLIAAVFGLSVLWKLRSPDYLDGSFFKCTFLTDIRCIDFFKSLHLMTSDLASRNLQLLSHLVNDAQPPATIILLQNNYIDRITVFFTYATLLTEILVVILFSMPEKYRLTKYRDYLLFAFLLVAYMVAPIWGFGSILCILGMAQTDSRAKLLTYLFFLCFMQIMLAFRIPFSHIINFF